MDKESLELAIENKIVKEEIRKRQALSSKEEEIIFIRIEAMKIMLEILSEF